MKHVMQLLGVQISGKEYNHDNVLKMKHLI